MSRDQRRVDHVDVTIEGRVEQFASPAYWKNATTTPESSSAAAR